MNITVTGGSGFIGRRLMKNLLDAGHSVHILSRHAGTNVPPAVKVSVWDATRGEPPAEALQSADAIVHLAGEPIAQRWTPHAKQKIRASRVEGTRRLVQALSTSSRRPAVLVSGSAIGIYGSRGDEVLTESSRPGSGFLSDVCMEWEKEADLAESLGIRVVKVRTGVALGRTGGALARMLPPFRNFVGGRIGSGRQWMSWIHVDDLAALMRHAIEGSLRGVVNGVAPNPATNAEFTGKLAGALRRPAILPLPAFVLKAIFGEMSQVLLDSQRVLPKAAETSGFQFRYPELGAALANLLK